MVVTAERSSISHAPPTLRASISQKLPPGHWSNLAQPSSSLIRDTPMPKDQVDYALIMVPAGVLLSGWERRKSKEGKPYSIDHTTQLTTWDRPDTRPTLYLVPAGWNYDVSRHGQLYWIDHSTRTTTWERPDYIPRGWKTRTDASLGRTCWFDPVTQLTTYEKPWYLPARWEARMDH